ncbi:hypothetical protein EV690_0988 [Celerinatantimonas diazotrophica]|uniref:Uncharacterized protein n=1 Tax=Celerinatantimonas diazotrophica TaxID=412034 RepID=A0A4R1K713_9GAMM|nr:hypothetical protein EV690_0988 [Celerinatantimonas diazotrophica]CAG9297471.1 hypothetical protein CEDIAZO_02652 [Celerinatantimonas diazotrophica]
MGAIYWLPFLYLRYLTKTNAWSLTARDGDFLKILIKIDNRQDGKCAIGGIVHETYL